MGHPDLNTHLYDHIRLPTPRIQFSIYLPYHLSLLGYQLHTLHHTQFTLHRFRVGNEPSYSGSARKKLGSGSARELNEPSLSLNLGLIHLGLDSGSLEKSSARAAGIHPSLDRGFRLRSPAVRIWSSPVRSRLRRARVKCLGHVSRISM